MDKQNIVSEKIIYGTGWNQSFWVEDIHKKDKKYPQAEKKKDMGPPVDMWKIIFWEDFLLFYARLRRP